MPKGTEHEWLNVNLSENEIAHMMKPLENGLLDAFPISKLITNKNKNPDSSEVQLPFSYPELDFIDQLES